MSTAMEVPVLEAAGEDTAAVHFKDARGRLCAIREGVRTSSELSPVSIVAHAPEWAWMCSVFY